MTQSGVYTRNEVFFLGSTCDANFTAFSLAVEGSLLDAGAPSEMPCARLYVDHVTSVKVAVRSPAVQAVWDTTALDEGAACLCSTGGGGRFVWRTYLLQLSNSPTHYSLAPPP